MITDTSQTDSSDKRSESAKADPAHSMYPILDTREFHRKLLNSHSSIFNALTNPDLELYPSHRSEFALTRLNSPTDSAGGAATNGIITPELGKPEVGHNWGMIDESWQCLSNDSIAQTQMLARTLSSSPFIPQNPQNLGRPSSLLSLTTDEDGEDMNHESMVIVSNHLSKAHSHSMVFETDEEDEDNEHRGSHDRFELDTTFIMPKVSMDTPLSNTCRQMTITLLSSCDLSCHNETNQLMSSVQRELGGNVNIVHLSLEKQSLRDRSNDQIIKDSNLIFIVNDGSFVFIDFLNNIFNGLEGPKDISESDYEDDSLPKLTVINMMTVNYFINLFDLINNLKPYQIWKTSSLSQQNLLNKFKDFIEYEMDNSLYCTTLSKETRSKFESSFVKERSNSVYSSLITVKRPNYKKLEKQFKAELSVDSSQVNPLNLDLKRLSCFNAICLVFGRLMNHSEKFSISTPSSSKIPNLYLIGSFTVGVSLGLGIASGLARVVGLYLSDGINTIADSIEPKTLVKEIKVDNSILSKLSNSVFENEDVFDGLVKYLSNLLSGLQSTSSFMVDAAKGGFQKLMAVVF